MNISQQVLTDKNQTAKEMKRLITAFADDLDKLFIDYQGKTVSLSNLPLERFHKFVREIPYKIDLKPVEVLMRPYYAVKYRHEGIDCKKKAILIASWAQRNGVEWRLIASSKRPDKRKHHVFPQLRLSGNWINADATYRQYRLGEKKSVTSSEVI